MPQLDDYRTQKKYDMNDLDENQKKEIEEHRTLGPNDHRD